MENPLVSVIMIFLNEERFIREAVESVLKQTYKNWELIFVDDGSTDGSTAIARQFARNYPQRIRYFEHKDHQNLGMSLSRNRGFDESRGRYIAILDADDVLFPQALKEQVETLEGYPDVSMVYGRVQKWHSWSMQAEEKRLDSL